MLISDNCRLTSKRATFRRSICFLLPLISALLLPPMSSAEGKQKPAIDAYNKKQYKQAICLLRKAIADDPYNAELHYYLANCYVFQKDGNAAIKEYSQCFDLEPLGTFGQYSRQALLGFGKKFHGFTSSQADNKHLAPDDPSSIKQAVELIRKQTGDREKLQHERAENAARVAVDSGEKQQQRISRAADELIECLTPVNKAPTQALHEEIHEIRQRAVFAGQRARFDAQQQATKHMEYAAQRAVSLEHSASSLLSLISENPKPGRIKVKAAGTNLYVRNYGLEPAIPIEPMQAEWELLPAANATIENTEPALLRPKPSPRVVSHKVHKQKRNMSPTVTTVEKPKEVEKTTELEKSKDKISVDTLNSAFVPGVSKVLVTDLKGKILVHIRDDGSK